MKIGYIRVSTQEQNAVRQEVLIDALGVEQIYIDKMSGKNSERPQLKEMMSYVPPGVIPSSWNPSAALPATPGTCWSWWNSWPQREWSSCPRRRPSTPPPPPGNLCSLCLALLPSWSGSISFSASGRASRLPKPRASTGAASPSSPRTLTE
ncbi:hypothetical protein BACCAP_02862 [Pseudoflavonifractor capillosus ATCC 29799]|uniref:Resolvase/invertase-type recombinase catalytic domain-containing protein n=1 Tax=Pseudoflavonifractor capillosus ATCC 29799 TaxID=411467 RepID=A6NXB6_9FIRM|nr:hypothetical protein BACCAP_02862 [Pseudoflavonifractor capillosus ATCC 29799]